MEEAVKEEIRNEALGLSALDYWVLGSVVGFCYLLSRLWLKKLSSGSNSIGEKKNMNENDQVEKEYKKFRRNYVSAYVMALGAEYIQTAQTFALLRHGHRAGYSLIAEVFAIGFCASWIASAFISIFRDVAPSSRRLKIECCLCLAAYTGSSFAILWWGGITNQSHPDIAVATIASSRVIIGMALPLLQNSFDAWMRTAHSALNFPTAWKRRTYEACGSGTTMASVFAGIIVEVCRRQFDEVAPFKACIILAVCGFAIILFAWPTVPSSSHSTDEVAHLSIFSRLFSSCSCRRGFSAFRSAPFSALLVVFAASFFEIAAYVTSATWATTLCRIHDHAPHRTPFYGYVFSLLMASAVVGTLLFQIFNTNKFLSIELSALLLAIFAAFAFGKLALDHTTQNATRAALPPLLFFQFSVGWSVPVFATLKIKFIPTELRSTLNRVFNFFYGLIVIFLILLIPSNTRLTFLILGFGMSFASLALFALYFFFSRRSLQQLPIRHAKLVTTSGASSSVGTNATTTKTTKVSAPDR